MAFTVKETTRRGGGSSSRSMSGRKAKRTFQVVYDADTPPASLAAVETADDGVTAIPALQDQLAGDTSRVVTEVSVKPGDGKTGLIFDVEVSYETIDPAAFDNEDPLTDPVDYEWDFSASSQTYFKDCTTPAAKFTVNSAGEPFENLLEREEGTIVVTVTDNIVPSAWDPAAAASYMKPATAINDAAMTIDGIGVDIGQARIGGIRCSGIKERNGVEYRTRTIILKLAESWDHKVDDRGFNELDPDAGIFLWEILKGGPPVKVDKPYPLDGAGHAKPNATDEPAELTFLPYPRKDFGIWGIT